MPRFRLDSIAQLARQMEFAPVDVRWGQLAAAESLLLILDASKGYPLDFVIFRITGYRPRTTGGELLTGLALQHDLGLLIERVSDSLDCPSASLREPVLAIDDLCQRFNVTSKTIQRWRRKGLPARRFIFPDNKRRVGFLLSTVERFIAAHADQVGAAANCSEISQAERHIIVRHARRLATQCDCCEEQITRRIARVVGRSPLTILHTLRKHDQENPSDGILSTAAPPIDEHDRLWILKRRRRGASLKQLARKLRRPRAAIHRILLEERTNRLLKKKVRFHDDPLYHQPDAVSVIDILVQAGELDDAAKAEDTRVPRDLPPFLAALYRTPLLTKNRERALFLKFNFHKYQFVLARRKLDPQRLANRDLDALESHLQAASQAKNAIVQANLRLVVSIARRHARPGAGLAELISDGNLTLMRAVDGFDVHRGNRFSTYATLALMKGFARSVPQMLAGVRTCVGENVLGEIADRNQPAASHRLAEQDQVRHLLSRLDDRERTVLSAHFGLDDAPASYEQLGKRFGLSKERIRQIEQGALAKLRTVAHN